jgi:hypothetical protein
LLQTNYKGRDAMSISFFVKCSYPLEASINEGMIRH